MKKILLSLLVIFILILSSCRTGSAPENYASLLTLDLSSSTVKEEVTVSLFVDGDTTHFNSFMGTVKARYIAVNTPESTGRIEEWGKRASAFTREKLETAERILIESDDGKWNLDSTGGRLLVWVWYIPRGGTEWRNLNLELLEEGLARPSSSANNRYGEYCMAAIEKAKREGKFVWSSEKDPDYFYGDSIPVTLREIRFNAQSYDGVKVNFEGTVTRNWNNSIYIEDRDPDTGSLFGISVYYGYSLSSGGLAILKPGNRVRIVGTVQYYEGSGSWQISGVKYREMKKDDPDNIALLGTGYEAGYDSVTVRDYLNASLSIVEDETLVTLPLYEALEDTTVSLVGLSVETVRSKSDKTYVLSLSEGEEISIRTDSMKNYDFYRLAGKTVNIKGIAETYLGSPQIRLFSADNITIE